MKKNIILAMLLCGTQAFALNDGFNFEGCSGSGEFEQEIQYYDGDYENAITVGEIPAGIEGLKINLKSDKDVDVRLYDGSHKIVHWPEGLLSGPIMNSVAYRNAEVVYSGYNGVHGKLGHEYIYVHGKTPSALTMTAFGYEAGYAMVDYSWTGKEGCTSDGEGNFTQSLEEDEISLVGEIPAGINNLYVALKSEHDLDIQLYGADGTVIVAWKPTGLLSGDRKANVDYAGMNIEWSGYNGDGTGRGNEYIKITGETTELLTMKVYGYESGFADVTYTWDDNNTTTPPPEVCPAVYAPVCGELPDCWTTEDGDMICADLMENGTLEKTFGNMCELQEANTSLYTIDFLHEGECNTTTPPPEVCEEIYAPVCGDPTSQLPDECGQNGLQCAIPFYFEPITYANMCVLENENASFLYEGECNVTEEPEPSVCSSVYAPVCGLNNNIQCVTTPCEVEKTYGNICELNAEEADFIHEGEC